MIKTRSINLFRRLSKKVILPLGGLSLLAALYGMIWNFFPLELVEISHRYELWKGKVHHVQNEEVDGYLYDSCKPGKGTSECGCVVMIHGLGDNAQTWKKVLLWPEENWKQMGLSHSLRLYAPNLPGSGNTPLSQDPSSYRVRNVAKRLSTILSSMCSDWVVVGNSFGGWVAAWLTLDHPELVSRLVLLDSAGLKSGRENRKLLEKPTLESMKEFQKKAYFRPREIPERVWKEIVSKAQANHATDIIQAQVPEDDLDLKLSTLRRPTLILWGKEDRITPITVGQEMRSLIPGVIWREVPECGHLPQKECPLPVIRSIIDMLNFGAA